MALPEFKKCFACGLVKPISEYWVAEKRGKLEAHSRCIECGKIYRKEKYKTVEEKEKRKEYAKTDAFKSSILKSFYGITLEQYNALFNKQHGLCLVCRQPLNKLRSPGKKKSEVAHVDHDHSCCPGKRSCGKCVRGILCGPCNNGLGCFKDNLDYLHRAMVYLAEKKVSVAC